MDDARVRLVNSKPVRRGAGCVVYRARMNRRVDSNHALAFAADLANELNLPLVFHESLADAGNERQAAFVLDGVGENARRVREAGIGYVFSRGEEELDAAAVVTDDYPTLPPLDSRVACYAVDASCIVPISEIGAKQYAAYAIRPRIRKLLPRYLRPVPMAGVKRESAMHALETAGTGNSGGRIEAERRLQEFLDHDLRRYARHRNEPSEHATSRLSPYLHAGHISALEVALRVKEHAAKHKLIADEFLEELIVRRELGFNFARYASDYSSLEELPSWARETLRSHARDKRPAVYSREEFVEARTHDALWNATQKEMLARGTIHPYYRMYWGKKIIEWSQSHEEALATMIEIHDRFALDGRDPNTYANILWCFGLHDRPWPERPVFGKVRYMSLEGMRRKTDVDAYIREIEAL